MNEQFINIRKKIGLSQKEIAEYLDANQNYIIKIENGECSLPVDLAEKMCNLIGYDISYFVFGIPQTSLNINFSKLKLNVHDLKVIARVNEIALKLKDMNKIA